jgi:hypothetical protein
MFNGPVESFQFLIPPGAGDLAAHGGMSRAAASRCGRSARSLRSGLRRVHAKAACAPGETALKIDN